MRHLFVAVAAAILVIPVVAIGGGQGSVQGPLIREGVTQKVAAHTYVIPDGNVGLVPNVGIIVGTTATLVIDPGLGRANGERVLREVAKVSKNANLYIATTHFHAEHTTGYAAFPPTARYVNSTIQEEEFAQGGPLLVGHVEIVGQRPGPEAGRDVHVPSERGRAAVAAHLRGGQAIGTIARPLPAVFGGHADAEQVLRVHVAVVVGREGCIPRHATTRRRGPSGIVNQPSIGSWTSASSRRAQKGSK